MTDTVEVKTVRVKIVGDTPLVTRRYEYDGRKSENGRRKRKPTPMEEFIDGIYWLMDETRHPDSVSAAEAARKAETMDEFLIACGDGAKFGFPASGIKAAVVKAAMDNNLVPEDVFIKGQFFIRAESNTGGLVEIKAAPPRMREDLVKIPGGTRIDSRFRPEFESWSCEFTLEYNAAGPISLEDILQMIDKAGSDCGIGEWRKQRSGTFGAFHVER